MMEFYVDMICGVLSASGVTQDAEQQDATKDCATCADTSAIGVSFFFLTREVSAFRCHLFAGRKPRRLKNGHVFLSDVLVKLEAAIGLGISRGFCCRVLERANARRVYRARIARIVS
jgi:hypothetical protein